MAAPHAEGQATPSDGLFQWVVGIVGALVLVAWAGAVVAAVAVGASSDQVPLSSTGAALVNLPGHFGDPAAAWPVPASDVLPGPVLYWVCQAAVLALGATVVVAGVRVWRKVTGAGNGPLGVDGDAGFARGRDLRRLQVDAPEPGRLTLGRGGRRLLACEPQASLAVVGPTGCGKTAGFAIPALLEWEGPVLATSVKADLLGTTIKARRQAGKVWVYDPTACSGHASDGWSPLAACTTWAGAQRMAAWITEAAQPRLDTVSDGDYWYTQARKALAPYLHAAAVSGAGIADVVRWIDIQERKDVELILLRATGAAAPDTSGWNELWAGSIEKAVHSLRKAGDKGEEIAERPIDEWPGWIIQELSGVVQQEWRASVATEATTVVRDLLAPLVSAQALWQKEERLRGSVFATMENALAGWADPGVAAAAATCDVDLDTWLAGDNTLYVVATAHEQARLRPVLTVLVQQAVRHAYDTASRNGGELPHPCLLLLDEAGNTAPLRDLPSYASTARSHGITLVTVWQDLAQIKAMYRDRAQTVLNNHRAKLFGAGIADAATLDYLSRLVGDEHRTERNLSTDLGGGRRSLSEHRTYRRAAPVDVLRRVRPGEAVLLYGSELPAHVRLRPWFKDRGLRTRAGVPNETRGRRSRAHLRR